MANYKNLFLDQNSTFTENIRYLDNSKNPISLVGYNVYGYFKKSFYTANSISFDTVITDATNGNVTISIDFMRTSNVPAGRYVYDVRANTANTALRIQEGILTVNPGVTK